MGLGLVGGEDPQAHLCPDGSLQHSRDSQASPCCHVLVPEGAARKLKANTLPTLEDVPVVCVALCVRSYVCVCVLSSGLDHFTPKLAHLGQPKKEEQL